MKQGMKLVPVILSGGAGTRLWPLSRESCPKQFHSLTDDNRTLLQLTIDRLQGMSGCTRPLVICNAEHRFLVAANVDHVDIMLEPVARGTAAAVAAATIWARALYGDDIQILVLSADHQIEDVCIFQQAIATARDIAQAGRIVIFGVLPTSPHTGYGYIQAAGVGGNSVPVTAFVEKPDEARAQSYFDQGGYFWNCGIFLFRAVDMMNVFERHAPDVLQAVTASVAGAVVDHDFIRLDAAMFATCPFVAIDVAIMEKIAGGADSKLVMVPLATHWSDIGSWPSLWEAANHDENGNGISGDVVLENVRNSYLYAPYRLVAGVGLTDVVVIDTPDAVLVAGRQDLDGLKPLVERLKKSGRGVTARHRLVHRPWGYFDTIERGDGFQVKRIVVMPGAATSLQSHAKRAEHWVVVRGVAEVVRGDMKTILTEGQSIDIPIGIRHRLTNAGPERLEIVEVQFGAVLEEDDIMRYDDLYGRS